MQSPCTICSIFKTAACVAVGAVAGTVVAGVGLLGTLFVTNTMGPNAGGAALAATALAITHATIRAYGATSRCLQGQVRSVGVPRLT
jgi:hypothetical protein